MSARETMHTVEEWLAQPEDLYLELIDGQLVKKAGGDWAHAVARAAIVGELWRTQSKPGGWWLGMSVDVLLGPNVFRLDHAGWRRARAPEIPRTRPLALRPDWLCEVLSDESRPAATARKLELHHAAGVPHCWVIDPYAGRLTVLRHTPSCYETVLTAQRGEVVHAEPFDAIEVNVGILLGDDPA